MEPKITISEWMVAKLNENIWLCDFHQNDDYLEFIDKFANSLTPKQRRNKFNYYAKKLSKQGICKHTFAYLSAWEQFNYGVRTVNNYQPINKHI